MGDSAEHSARATKRRGPKEFPMPNLQFPPMLSRKRGDHYLTKLKRWAFIADSIRPASTRKAVRDIRDIEVILAD